ncbi:MAG: ArsC/Spx/MgsR family protein [Cardiobacteriaceae bacterium]|nr:ArsC/Spx/MgsR family protein [Cardiobacteriaceae bacterium]
MKLYGIANCDSVKAVRKQLDGKDYTFIDFKQTPPSVEDIRRWQQALGDKLVNKQSRTYREHKAELEAAQAAGDAAWLAALAAQPLVLKRPIVETAQGIAVGKNALSELGL